MTSVDIARAVVWYTNYSNRDDRCLYIFSLDTLQDYKCILAKTFNGRIHIGEWLSVRGATEYDGYLSINKNNYEILPFPCLPTTTSDRKVAISVHIILSSDGAHESSRGQVAWSPELQRVYMGARYEEMQKDKFYNLDVVRANRDAQNTYDVLWMTTEYSFPKEAQESYQKEHLRESQELMRESARRYPPGFLNDGHYNTGRVWQVLADDEELNNGYRKPKPGRRRYKANAGLGPGPSDRTTFETFRPASLGQPLFSNEINRRMRNTLRHTFPGVIVRKPSAHEVGLVYSETLHFVVLERSYTESKDQRVNVTLGDWVMMCVRHNKKGRCCGGLQVTRLIRKAFRHFITHVVDGNVQLEVAVSLTDEYNADRERMLAKRMNLTESCVAFSLPFLGYVGVPVAIFNKLRGKKIHAVIECRPTESKEMEIGWQVVQVIRDDMEPDEVLKGVHNDNDYEVGEAESEHVGGSEENDDEGLSDEETESSEGDLDEYEGAEMERNPVRSTVQQRPNVVDNRRGTATNPSNRYDMKGFTNSEQYDRAVNLVNGAANRAYQGSAPRDSVPPTAGKDEWHDIRPPTRAATQAMPPRRSPPPPEDDYVFNDYKKERHNSETVPPRAATQTHRSPPEDDYVFNDYKKEHQGSAPSSETGPPRRVSPPISANKSDDGYTYNDYTKKHQSVYPDTSRLAARLGSDQHQAALPSSSQQGARARESQPQYTTPLTDPDRRMAANNSSDDGYAFDDYQKKYQSVYPDTSRLGSNRFDRPPPGNQNQNQVTQREAPGRSMSRNNGSGSTLSANSAPSRRPGGGFSTSSRNPSGSESRASAAQSQHTAAVNEPLRRRSPPRTTSDAAPFTEYPRPGVPSLYSDLSSYPSLETTPSMLPRNRDVNVVRKELPLPPPAAPGDPVFDFEFDNEQAQDNAVGLICVRTASGPFFVIARVGENAAITAVLPPLLAEDFDVGDWVVLSVAPLRKPLPGCDHVVIAPAIKHAEKQNITRPVGNYLIEVLSSTCAGRVKAYNSSTLMVSPDFGEILFPNKGVPSLANNGGLIFPQQLRDEHVVWLVPQVVDGRFELVVTSVLGRSQDRAPKQLPDSCSPLSRESTSRILRDFDDYIRPAPQACCSAVEVLKSLWKLPEVKMAAKQGDYHVYSQVEDLLDPRNQSKKK